jgi:hypothetical protein
MNPITLLAIVVSLSATLLAAGCTEDTQQTAVPDDPDLTLLLQSWARSYEEETGSSTKPGQVFRPSDFKQFPATWFRMRYIFGEDRKCEWLVLHPSDAHFMKQGTWTADPRDDRVILIYDTNGTLVESVSFKILELEENLLRVEVGMTPNSDA